MSQKTTITLLVLDVDGVMSDGKVTYTSDGAELKSFNIKDGVGIKCIQKAGVQTAIITGRVSPMVARRASELGIHHLIQGREDKLAALKELITSLSIELKNVAYMGDDLPDIEAITSVGIGACPADA
ncbi:MAG: HAD hydrolase family protein, partial [Halieaceae bacterium]